MRWFIAFLFLSISSTAWACPDDQYESCFFGMCVCLPKGPPVPKAPDPIKILVNPGSYINSAGIPTTGDFMEQVIKQPEAVIEMAQYPGNLFYAPVATGIVSSRNAIVARGRPIPEPVIVKLRPWYAEDLMRSVRWTSDYGGFLHSLQAAQMTFNPNTNAIALMNGVVFRNDGLAQDPVLWAHELFHVQQYRDWGVFNFARKWVENSSEGGPIEEVRPGDVIWFPSGEKHWHGATPTTAMTHIAIQEMLGGKNVDWMEKVTDDQYRK